MTLGGLIVVTLAAVALGAGALKAPIVTTSLVLEEVLEHGPLFDELEDEAWWSGVDVVDTALPSSSSRFWSSADPTGAINVFGVESELSGWTESAAAEPANSRDEFCRFWNENDCPSSASFSVPRLPPPPPAPPGLADLVRQLQQRQKPSPDLVTGEDEVDCLLCQWAALNGTIDLVPNSELSSDNSWVPMLVVVALGSAMLGAVLMITALKCRRLKVLPRGGSCPTLPVGYMVGEGKEQGVVQTNVAEIDTISKSYSLRNHQHVQQDTLGRPRLETPTLINQQRDTVEGQGSSKQANKRWHFWKRRSDAYPYAVDQSDAVSAVYAELNSVAGSTSVHRTPSVALYHLNTYSEIREPGQHLIPPPPVPHQQTQTAATLHLRRLLSDGTYENAAYALERGVILVEHENSSTPSSAYYSDLSHSDRSGSVHNHLWQQRHHRPRTESLSAQSLPYHHNHHHHHHCCHHHDDDEALVRPVRDLMPVALSVVPDNQQVPVLYHDQFARCSTTSSSLRGADDAKRPLPPLPSRQQQRPQRRFAYAVDPQHEHQSSAGGSESSSSSSGSDSTLSCVPSEYV